MEGQAGIMIRRISYANATDVARGDVSSTVALGE